MRRGAESIAEQRSIDERGEEGHREERGGDVEINAESRCEAKRADIGAEQRKGVSRKEERRGRRAEQRKRD